MTAYAGRHPGPDDLVLVVEVADTSRRTDLIVNPGSTAVPAYRVVDLNGRQTFVHTLPVEGEYTQITAHGDTGTIGAAARPDSRAVVADLFPPTEQTPRASDLVSP